MCSFFKKVKEIENFTVVRTLVTSEPIKAGDCTDVFSLNQNVTIFCSSIFI